MTSYNVEDKLGMLLRALHLNVKTNYNLRKWRCTVIAAYQTVSQQIAPKLTNVNQKSVKITLELILHHLKVF